MLNRFALQQERAPAYQLSQRKKTSTLALPDRQVTGIANVKGGPLLRDPPLIFKPR
jgi:hypothetical protein